MNATPRTCVDDFDMCGQPDPESEAFSMRLSAQVELQFMMLMAKVSLRELRLTAGNEIQRLVEKIHGIARNISSENELQDSLSRNSETDQRSSELLMTIDEIHIALGKLEYQTQVQQSSDSNSSVSR
jgi:hypothetical protein